MKKRLLVVGGVGSGQIALSVFEAVNQITGEWKIEGYLNDILNPGDYFGNHVVVGGSDEVEDYVQKGYYIHYALHFNAKKKNERVDKLRSLNIPREAHASAVHPTAYIDPNTEIGIGTLISPNVSTSFGPKIGDFCHLYMNSFVGHDTEVSDYCTLAAHSVLGARNKISEGAHIGLNSCTREDLYIGKYSIVGMGSVVIKDVEDYSIHGGNPAKFIRKVL
jgi:acetyltransferase EpsM